MVEMLGVLAVMGVLTIVAFDYLWILNDCLLVSYISYVGKIYPCLLIFCSGSCPLPISNKKSDTLVGLFYWSG